MLISDIINVIVTSKKDILDMWNNIQYFQISKMIIFTKLSIELLISRIDLSTSCCGDSNKTFGCRLPYGQGKL